MVPAITFHSFLVLNISEVMPWMLLGNEAADTKARMCVYVAGAVIADVNSIMSIIHLGVRFQQTGPSVLSVAYYSLPKMVPSIGEYDT